MRRIVVCVALTTGCTFVSGRLSNTGTSDAAGDAVADGSLDGLPDGSPPSDTMVAADAPTAADCHAQTDDTQLDNAGKIGGNGGSSAAMLQCDAATDLIVGVALRVSNQDTANGGRSARAFDISCATVTIHPNQTATLGVPYLREATGSGTFMWNPSTLTATASCPSGSVVSGLDAHTGPSTNLFINVTISCEQLGSNGLPTGTTSAVYVTGSLTETAGDDSVTCASGRVLRRIDPFTGSGFDSATLRCAPSKCMP